MSEKIRNPLELNDEKPSQEGAKLDMVEGKSERDQTKGEVFQNAVESEGELKGWSDVIENKKLGVSYHEKVTELPRSRQEETGIKQIRRREVLVYPKGFCLKDKKGQVSYSTKEKFDATYQFLTNGRFPSDFVLVHKMNLYLDQKVRDQNIIDFKAEGLYFQTIMPKRGSEQTYAYYRALDYNPGSKEIWKINKEATREFKGEYADFELNCASGRIFSGAGPTDINYPVFVFGNRNKSFLKYAESFHDYFDGDSRLQKVLKGESLPEREEILLPVIKRPGRQMLRWCNAELALMPTRKNLNVLFFETGDEGPPARRRLDMGS